VVSTFAMIFFFQLVEWGRWDSNPSLKRKRKQS
jgi:hypothetical protein